jgi:hypothetical protein
VSAPRAKIVDLPTSPKGDRRPHVRRLTAEIEIDGVTELVAVIQDERGVRAVASDGRSDGPYVEAALALFGEMLARPASEHPEPIAEAKAKGSSPRLELKAAVEELITATVRAGIGAAKHAPAFKLALDTLTKLAEREVASGLERFIGRLRNAVEFGDVEECAMLLGGATQLVADLAEDDPGDRALERISGWVHLPGPASRETPIYEHDFVEMGREWVAGISRAALQRRYLVDVGTGEIYREITRAGRKASVGPCPRFIHAGLALSCPGTVPTRLRLMQYEVSPEVPSRAKRAMEAHAHRGVAGLLERFRAAHAAAPGQAEPFALFAPAGVTSEEGTTSLVDDAGMSLPLASSEGLELDTALVRAIDGAVPRVVAGRLFLAEGVLILRPFSLLLGEASAEKLVRLR